MKEHSTYVERRQMMDSFLDKIERPIPRDDCWIWKGAIDRGYGLILVKGRKILAHRFSFQYFIGPVPRGLVVHHLCHNKNCVNPIHLYLMRPDEHTSHHSHMSSRFLTHCKRGHPMRDPNLYYCRGIRRCRACKIEAYQKSLCGS
jgi:hypothetical protein